MVMWGVIAIVSEMVGRSLDGMGLLWVIYGMRILDETVDEMMELLFRRMFRVIWNIPCCCEKRLLRSRAEEWVLTTGE